MISPVVGHGAAVRQFLHARDSGRFHHAWLLQGPKGIGKTSLALNLAAQLLGANGRLDDATFTIDEGAVRDHIIAGSHPDFRMLSRAVPEGEKQKQDIPVGDVRQLLEFFSLKPAMGGYRVAIVDSLDELNRNGANALLKTLEEPPPKCVLFLIYHGQTGLLPTIRSRCQKLVMHHLSDELTSGVATDVQGDVVSPELLRLAHGSPGKLLSYLSEDSQSLVDALTQMTKGKLSEINANLLNKVLREAARSETHFDLLLSFLEDWFTALVSSGNDVMTSKHIASAWQMIRRDAGRSTDLNIDLTERVAGTLSHLRSLLRQLDMRNAV